MPKLPPVACLLAVVAAGSGCGGSHPVMPTAVTASAVHGLTATPAACIGSWPPTTAGPHAFPVANRGRQPLQVTFIDSRTGDIYGEIPQLDPGTTRPLQVDAPAGSYRFRCVPRRGVAAVSAVEKLRGGGGSANTALRPLSAEEIDTAVATYRRGVRRGIERLVPATDRLTRAVDAGRWSAARRSWLAAHMTFGSLGAAYGSFGSLADRIDGRADGLPRGVDDARFTGFLAVEHLLWHPAAAAARRSAAATLDRDVHLLAARFPHLKLVAGDLPLRAHEILENALEFELTGDTDEGSHTNLATVLANVRGTALVVRALTPSIEQRRPALLTTINDGLRGLARSLSALRVGHTWPSVTTLPRRTRERLDAQVDGLLEQLSALPGMLTLPASLALP